MTAPGGTIFIVDDDASIRGALSRALTLRGFAVQTFESAEEFLANYAPEDAGCLVLDYGMPRVSGLDLQDRLNEIGYRIPIIFISGHGGVPETVRAMRSGAVDFLEKPFRQEVLIERIQAALEIDATTRRDDTQHAEARRRLANLTEREAEIAKLIVSHPSEASSKFIARMLDISPRTVDHHRARILEKMVVKSVAELVDLNNKAGLFD